MPDVAALHRHWAEYGPPVHIALTAVAAGWGIKLARAAAKAAPAIDTDPLQGLGDLPVVALAQPARGFRSS